MKMRSFHKVQRFDDTTPKGLTITPSVEEGERRNKNKEVEGKKMYRLTFLFIGKKKAGAG